MQSIRPRHIRPDEIRAARRDMGLTQAQLAEKLGVGKTTIRNWEALGVKPPKMLPLALAWVWFERQKCP